MIKKTQKPIVLPNMFIYGTFLGISLLFVCFKDFETATIFAGIGLAFDPFNQAKPFTKRPLWQRLWLVCHLIFTLSVILISIFYKP